MKRSVPLGAVSACLAALAVSATATASKPRSLTSADRKAINATLDVFVNHGVKRHDTGVSYSVVTPELRGGMTRKQWSRGSIPVYPYPAKGQRFHGWTIEYHTSDELAIQLILHPRRGSELGTFVFHVYLKPVRRRWLVDSFMPAATIAPAGGKVTAVTDFMPQPQGGASLPTGPHRISSVYAVVPFAVMGLILVTLAGWGLAARLRDRRLAGSSERHLPPLPVRYSRSR
jgi:hypothetical protein